MIKNSDDDKVDISKNTCQFCPNCQMPFDVLRVQTVDWHLAECLEIDRTDQLECSMGRDCDCTIVSHYLKFTHYSLAAHHSGVVVKSLSSSEDTQNTLSHSPFAIGQRMIVPKKCINGRTLIKQSPEKKQLVKKYPDPKQPKITSFFNSANFRVNEKRLEGPSPIMLEPNVKLQLPMEHAKTDHSKVSAFEQSKKPHSDWTSTLMDPLPFRQSTSIGTGASNLKVQRIDNARKHSYCPKYKKIIDLPFVVDAFKYGEISGINAYFLSHFHSDHYVGLTNKFRKHLYCSQVTANLVKLKFRGIPVNCVHVLPLNETCFVNGVEITLIEANHCPGAVMFLFRYMDGRTVLHTGDFRADIDMERHPALSSPSLNVDFLYLDTTYCQPLYDFPTQNEVLEFVVNVAKKQINEGDHKTRTLIVCGSYTIGKEKVFLAIAQALKLKVWAPKTKRCILECLEDKCLNDVLTDEVRQAGIHVLAMGELSFDYLEEYLSKSSKGFSSVLAFRPTGWEQSHNGKNNSNKLVKVLPRKRGNVTIYGVPYSEHSSFSELRRFIQFVKPVTVIPTVNVSGANSGNQMEIIRSWTRKNPFDSPATKVVRG